MSKHQSCENCRPHYVSSNHTLCITVFSMVYLLLLLSLSHLSGPDFSFPKRYLTLVIPVAVLALSHSLYQSSWFIYCEWPLLTMQHVNHSVLISSSCRPTEHHHFCCFPSTNLHRWYILALSFSSVDPYIYLIGNMNIIKLNYIYQIIN